MSFSQDVFNFVYGNLDSYTVAVYQGLLASWPAQSLATIYVAIGGYMVLMGNAGKHAKEMGVSIFMLLVLQGIVTSGYTEWISAPIISTAMELSALAADPTGAHGSTVFQSLDDGLGRVMTTIERISPTGSFLTDSMTYIKVGAVSLAVSLAYGLLYVAFLVLYCIAWFGIFMMLMVGCIFLWLGAFKATRPYTHAWFKAMMNYVLWQFFLSAIMGIFSSVISAYCDDLAQWDISVQGVFPPAAGKLIIFAILNAWLLLKCADWSAALTGGTSMSPGIVTSGVGLVGGAAGSAGRYAAGNASTAASAASSAGRWAAGGAMRAYSALKGVK